MITSKFNRMTFQWFGSPDIPFEEPDKPEFIEVSPDDDDQEEAEKERTDEVKLSKEEYERLVSGRETNEGLRETMEGLKQVLNKQSSATDEGKREAVQKLSPEEFKAEFNKKLFEDDPYSEVVKLIDQRVGPYVGQALQNDAQTNKKLLLIDPDKGKYARKYKDEMESLVEGLPKQQQNNPGIWDYAYREVMKNHEEDIINERVESRVNEVLREKGLLEGEEEEEEAVKTSRRKPSSGQRSGQAGSKGKPVVKYSRKDQEAAADMGVTLEDYLLYMKE